MIRGWIQYFKISSIKVFLEEFGQWLRHKVRCIITHDDIFKCANSRLGWYRRSTGNIVNFLLSPTVLGIKKGDRPGLVNPLIYYLEIL